MAWQQLTLHTTREYVEALEAWCDMLGALAITLCDDADEPILEPKLGSSPVWSHTAVTALFEEDCDTAAIEKNLTTQFAADQIAYLAWQFIPDEDWERRCLADAKPLCFADKLWVVPSHCQAPDDASVIMQLDPGLAFGTGTHPTTAMCLAWLAEHVENNASIIDYGCGSGILAIAALLLGAEKAIAIDYDPQALLATKENAAKNNIAPERLEVCLPENFQTTVQSGLVVANILANPLISLANLLTSLTASGGYLVLSGLLTEQEMVIKSAYPDKIQWIQTVIQDQWCLLVGKKID